MSNIRKEITRGPVTIDRIHKSTYQKEGTLTAQLRQVVTTKTIYPSPSVTDGITSNLFAGQFANKGKEYTNTENRVAFLVVPSHITVQMLQAKLNELIQAGNKPGIMKVTSNAPILTDNQKNSISEGLKSKDDYAKSQAVRYSMNNQEGNAGKLILDDAGNVIYKRTFFLDNISEDVNSCGDEIYVSDALAQEMATLKTETVDNGLLF